MSKRKSSRELVTEAARAHTDLNIFYAIIGVLEGGTISPNSDAAAQRIIRICKAQSAKCLLRYDHARVAISSSEKQS